MGKPDLVFGNAQDAAQVETVFLPITHEAFEQRVECGLNARRRMDAVCDRIDRLLGKHQSRYLGMPLGHAIHIMAEVESQICHFQALRLAALELKKFSPIQKRGVMT